MSFWPEWRWCSIRIAEPSDRRYIVSLLGLIGAVLFMSGIAFTGGRDTRFDKHSGRVTVWGEERGPLSDVRSVTITSARKGPTARTFKLALLTEAGRVALCDYLKYAEALGAALRIGGFLGIPAAPETDDVGHLIRTVIPPGPKRPSASANKLAFGSPWEGILVYLWPVPLSWGFAAPIANGIRQGDVEHGFPTMSSLQVGLLKAALGGLAVALLTTGVYFLVRAIRNVLHPPCLFDRGRDVVSIHGREICRITNIRALGWSDDKDPVEATAYVISVLAGTNEEYELHRSIDEARIEDGVKAMAAFVQKPVWKFYE